MEANHGSIPLDNPNHISRGENDRKGFCALLSINFMQCVQQRKHGKPTQATKIYHVESYSLKFKPLPARQSFTSDTRNNHIRRVRKISETLIINKHKGSLHVVI